MLFVLILDLSFYSNKAPIMTKMFLRLIMRKGTQNYSDFQENVSQTENMKIKLHQFALL